LDPRTKHVVHVVYGSLGVGNQEAKVIRPAHLVNSGLDTFIASTRAVTDRFPYDSGSTTQDGGSDDTTENGAKEDKTFDEWDQAAREMTETLRAIDPVAVEDPDSFWMTFIADVQMGNYSTTDILYVPSK
jgi:SUKH-4 immunity protein